MLQDSSVDKLSQGGDQLQITFNTGGKKEATFLDKLTKPQNTVANYGFLTDSVNMNELAARGVNISIRDHLKAQGLNMKDVTKAKEGE